MIARNAEGKNIQESKDNSPTEWQAIEVLANSRLKIEPLAGLFSQKSDAVSTSLAEDYQIVFFLKGSGKAILDFTQWEICPNRLFCIAPGQATAWSVSPDVEGYMLRFPKRYFEPFLLNADYPDSLLLFQCCSSCSAVDLHSNEQQFAQKLFGQISIHYQDKPHPHMLRVLLLELLISAEQWMQACHKATTGAQIHPLLDSFKKLIERHFIQVRMPNAYANMLMITRNHLNAVCKASAGLQAGEMVRNRVVLQAKRMLATQQTTIADIACNLHFRDNSYFTKFFKKHTGQTPEEFRQVAFDNT